jgi:two-component system chemotaxis response regulator CheB
MKPLRLLLVDDSSVARRLVSAALSRHPGIEVAAMAATGEIALAKLGPTAPDAVVLDIEMPGLDGIETLRRIRAIDKSLPVVMFSSLTERGACATLDALAAGANDYALKPSLERGETLEAVIRDLLVPKLQAVTAQRDPRPRAPVHAPVAAPLVPAPPRPAAPRVTPEVVVIASSTGGPNALGEVLPALPADLPVPVLVVQHMPPVFTRCLAERLDGRGPLRVREAAGGEDVSPGTVWIAPGGLHLEVARDGNGSVKTALSEAPPENSCRPSADVLFRSAARVFGPAVLAVVLTGMGDDGARGARTIVEAGGRAIAQSGPTCVVWGMPKAVEDAGLADGIVPLKEVARAIADRVRDRGVKLRAARTA